MSVIGKNIKKIRVVKKLSQASFAEIFNLARPSVGAYEEERSEPKLETVIQIAKYFGISVDSLLTKELTINDLYHFNVHVEEGVRRSSARKNIPDKNTADIKTSLVPAAKQLEYIVQIHNRDFMAGLPKVYVPGYHDKNIRAFEKRTDDMHIHSEGIFPGDLVFAKKINATQSYQTGKIVVVITKEQLIIRRVKQTDKLLELQADNPNYPPLVLNPKLVIESWEVVGFFTRKTDPPTLVAERIMHLEHQFEQLNERLQKVENEH